jgi:hypothetical protein
MVCFHVESCFRRCILGHTASFQKLPQSTRVVTIVRKTASHANHGNGYLREVALLRFMAIGPEYPRSTAIVPETGWGRQRTDRLGILTTIIRARRAPSRLVAIQPVTGG